jgi:dihydroorotate dehydrogenase electron transfer subunit
VSRQTAPFGRRLLRVTGNEELGAYRVLRLAVGGWSNESPSPDPGQFAMLAAAERWGGGEDERPHLPRACSYARATAEGEAHFLLEDVGPGTRRLCELQPGEQAWAVGPLGVGFVAPTDGRRAILVGGGAGIAPLAIWQDTLVEMEGGAGGAGGAVGQRPAGRNGDRLGRHSLRPHPQIGQRRKRVSPGSGRAPLQQNVAGSAPPTVLLGFRDGLHAQGAALLKEARVATDDGSVGHRGLVTELLEAELASDPHAAVYACGPAPMLEAVRALCAERALPAQLALESGMACGFGACFGCVVPRRGGGYLRVCVEGPVIDAAELERVDAHAGAPA